MVAVGRIGFGAALLLAPRRFTEPWLGSDARRGGTQVAARGLGARDLALGLGTLASPPAALRAWVGGSTIGDLTDLLATVASDEVPLGGKVIVGALASGAVGLGVAALVGLSGQPD